MINKYKIYSLLKFIFPPSCVVCNSFGELICKGCKERIKKQIILDQPQGNNYFLFSYSASIKKLIGYGKYEGYYQIFFELIEIIPNKYFTQKFRKVYKSKNSLIIPVPINKFKKMEREFNQTEKIAEYLNDKYKYSHLNLLLKPINTNPQVLLNKSEREGEVNPFCINSNLVKKYLKQIDKITNLIVLDDVFTTGKTINDCIQVLKKEFPNKNILGLCLAKA